MLRKVYYFVFVFLIYSESNAAQRYLQGFVARNLMNQEVSLLKDYLVQIEDVSKIVFSEEQVKFLSQAFDSKKLSILTKEQLKQKRTGFSKKRIMVASDWSYHTQQKMPNLLTIPEQPRWDLHHIVFLRLNGENIWWNIVPLPEKEHHSIIHGKDQPGELLHRYLATRLAGSDEIVLDWDDSWLESSSSVVDSSSL